MYHSPKIVIIGAGFVGSTFAFSLMLSGLAQEIVLIDVDQEKAEGECLDLNHGLSFVPTTIIYAGDYEDCRNADIVVITAGANQKPGETRLDLVEKNTAIFKKIIPQVTQHIDINKTILLVVTNPVDILSYVTYKLSGLPSNQVIGSGTVLDTSRLHYLISKHCQINPRNIHAYIIGEHGDAAMVAWSAANVGGMPLVEYCVNCPHSHNNCIREGKLDGLLQTVKDSAYQVIKKKGATYYAVSLALVHIVRAILRDENTILPVSCLINDYYEINDLYLSVPSRINKHGVQNQMRLKLQPKEQEQLKNSAAIIKKVIKDIAF